ncbi:helix-turn-helix domain-containing protein [Lactiplantibacillus pingfangensis]|uniref:helix-turn-helix domain-containing protein n=1 Tax=Lactiplantibacillus pingfangensis TaxID=2559915 RepID=UPI001485354A|nr:helix-turn-helix domain-containing protein [Lactiplantibacillus pingfangensis]
MKIINQKDITHRNKVFNKDEKYTEVTVRENVKVFTEQLENTHHYWIPVGQEINNEDNWLEPMTDVDQNVKSDYEHYRKKYHFLTPEAIKQQREALGLNLREAATIIGMSYSTLSDIEKNKVLQSMQQEDLLRYFFTPFRLNGLVENHAGLIEERLAKYHIKIDHLTKKLTDAQENEQLESEPASSKSDSDNEKISD